MVAAGVPILENRPDCIHFGAAGHVLGTQHRLQDEFTAYVPSRPHLEWQIRRRVLEALLGSHAPLGAYELIDRLAERGARPAPITIYRALDFLREQGLVHRIESRNAFIACVHNHASGDPVVFLICERCGAVGEAASAAVADTIKSASRAAGFTPKTPVIEISGICAHCKAA